MGIGSSTTLQLLENEYLKKLSSTDTISEYDPFWNQLFSYQNSLMIHNDRVSSVNLEEVTQKYCKLLFANNQRTGNFTSLVKIFMSRSQELQSSAECRDEIFVWQTQNALHIIRHLCKFLVENMTEDKIIEQFEACSLDERKKELSAGSVFSETPQPALLKAFIGTLMDVVVKVPVLQLTYSVLLEAVNCMIILLSVQMFVPYPLHHGPLHNVFFSAFNSVQINAFVHGLFQNFVEQREAPKTHEQDHEGGSLVLGLAATVATGLRSMLKFSSQVKNPDSMSIIRRAMLAHQCSLLTLVLINHQVIGKDEDAANLYKQAICLFRHVQGRQKGAEQSSQESPSFHINLSRLYITLCNTQALESGTLMLYFLLHNNPDVKAYVLSKTDIESLVLPILQILYIAPTQNSHHIYMALIVLLILTEDDHFNKSIHGIQLPSVPWFTERVLTRVSLGDLMILVVLRVIQFNMYQLRDRYLHTNCLAALANMSSQFRSIHSYPAQKIFELISALTKRHKLYKQKLAELPVNHLPAEGQTATVIEPERNYAEEVQVLEEVIRMLLEIVNSCFSTGLHRQNYNLVYALLQKREVFSQLKMHQPFADVLQNIETIIEFFGGKIDQINVESLTQNEVQRVIEDTVMQLPSHYLHKFPELKFRYLEEETPEDFFVPYVWSLVYNKSGIYWNPGSVQLFSLEQ